MPYTHPERTISDEDSARRLLSEHQQLHHANQLTAAEIEAVRAMLESDRFWKRIGATLKTWAVTITAVVAAWTVGLDVLKNLVKTLGGK